MVARTRRNVTSHVHNLSCLDCFSSSFAIVLHDPWKLELSREHLYMCCANVLIEFLPSRVRFMNIDLWQLYWMINMPAPHLRIPLWRTLNAQVWTLTGTFPPVHGAAHLCCCRFFSECHRSKWSKCRRIFVCDSQLHEPYPGGRVGCHKPPAQSSECKSRHPHLNLAASQTPRCNLTAERSGVFAAS